MSQDFAAQVIYNGILTLLIVSLPSVGIGMIVGFLISLFQAVTQIQEQTLTFVPKVVAVMAVLAFTSPWMMSTLIDFSTFLWQNIPNMVK